jgi:hypothetical protein
MINPPTANELLRRLGVAAWGVCLGLLAATAATAALVAARGDTQDVRHPDLLPSQYLQSLEVVPWQERYERTWYGLACACGALGGWAVLRFARPIPALAALTVVAFVPAGFWACRGVFEGHPSAFRLLAGAAVLAVPLAWRGRPAAVVEGPPNDRADDATRLPQPNPVRMWLTAAALALPLAAVLYAFLGPHHVPSVASECNQEMHVASYLVGPALYYRAPGAVPGLDFESHYGIGHAYAFSRVMGGGGLEKALKRYVLFVITLSILYYVSALFVLTDWLRNPWAALSVTLTLALSICSGLAYNTPSCWPVRYPFLFAFLFCVVRGLADRRWCVAAGGVAGVSLFWQTDVGLYALAAGAALYTAGRLFLGSPAWRPVQFLGAGAATFFAICTALFGPRVLSVAFAERLVEPLLLYASGFGNFLMLWRPGWGYWYNLVGPGIAIGSVAVLIGGGRRGAAPPRAVVYGAAASFLGLAMLFKWVNRSIDILWWFNGEMAVAVAGWWACVGWRALSDRLSAGVSPPGALLRRAAVVGACLALVVVVCRRQLRDEPEPGMRKSPVLQTAVWLDNFRSPFNAARKGFEPNVHPSPVEPEAARYLRGHTRRTERVAVISGADWNYLAAAGRAPRLYWLQLFLVHSPVLLDRCVEDLRNADRVFVDRNGLDALRGINPAAHAAVVPVLAGRFELADDSSRRWLLYRRKPGSSAGRRVGP